jgi:hypothetical protein
VKKPYAIVSDTHNHNWSAFATILPTGVNSRLQATLDEFGRVSKELYDAGGINVYHAGDLFHVRGSVAPSVYNPTRDLMHSIHSTRGTNWIIDPGNHDLEGKHADRLGSAVAMIRDAGIEVVCKSSHYEHGDGTSVLVVPWFEKVDHLRTELEEWAKGGCDAKVTDCIIHAPVNGVIMGIPDHGLDVSYLASLGFKRVFAGHYHNHKDFGNGVYSIGALTHLTWSDVDSKAGFLLVYDDRVEWRCTRAPQFIEIDSSTDPKSLPLICDGNFVRVKLKPGTKPAAVLALREHLEKKCGAKGVRVDIVKESTRIREGAGSVKAGASVEVSIADYIKAKGFPNATEIHKRSLQVLAEAA